MNVAKIVLISALTWACLHNCRQNSLDRLTTAVAEQRANPLSEAAEPAYRIHRIVWPVAQQVYRVH